MMKTTPSLTLLATMLACALCTVPVHAQSKRTFVSAAGNDSNAATNCQVTAPCRTFGGAYSVTIANGEINVLDPAGYGTLTITQGLSIVGHGWGTITSQSGDAITVNAPFAHVLLSGLSIEGAGTGGNGIVVTGGTVVVANSVIRRFVNTGIAFTPSTQATFEVTQTIIADNGQYAILVQPAANAYFSATFNRVEAYNNFFGGIRLDGSLMPNNGVQLVATATDCVVGDTGITNTSANGYAAHSASTGGLTTFHVSRSVAQGTFNGVIADGARAQVWVGQSYLRGNTLAWDVTNGASLVSWGDNYTNTSLPAGGSTSNRN